MPKSIKTVNVWDLLTDLTSNRNKHGELTVKVQDGCIVHAEKKEYISRSFMNVDYKTIERVYEIDDDNRRKLVREIKK